MISQSKLQNPLQTIKEQDVNNETAKAFLVDGNPAVKSGFISFQSNSHPIDFLKIELLEY